MHVNGQDGARGRRAVILCSRAEAPTDGRPARRTVTAPPPGARTAARPPPPTSAVEGDEPRDGREALRRCTRGRRTPRRADQGVRAADPEPTRLRATMRYLQRQRNPLSSTGFQRERATGVEPATSTWGSFRGPRWARVFRRR